MGEQPRAPGSEIPLDALGPAHVLLMRIAAANASVGQSPELRFEAPLRRPDGRVARGSDLHRAATLGKLLRYPTHRRRPDLAIILVDEDGVSVRRKQLTSALAGIRVPPHLLAVAVREFESWLIADHKALSEVAQTKVEPNDAPDRLDPGQAKEKLRGLLAGVDERVGRRQLAERLDLDLVGTRSKSFQRFCNDVRKVLSGLGR